MSGPPFDAETLRRMAAAPRPAPRSAVAQTLLAIVACAGFLGAGLILGYKLHVNKQALARDDLSPVRLPAREPHTPTMPSSANPDWADKSDELEVRRLLGIENAAANARDVKVAQSLYSSDYTFRSKDGSRTNFTETMQQLAALPTYPREWRRHIFIRSNDSYVNRVRVFLQVRTSYPDSSGRSVMPEAEVMETWIRIGGHWRKHEGREL
jgi:hypothetical protein